MQHRPITPVQVTYLSQDQIFKLLGIDPIPIVEAMHRGLDIGYEDTRNLLLCHHRNPLFPLLLDRS